MSNNETELYNEMRTTDEKKRKEAARLQLRDLMSANQEPRKASADTGAAPKEVGGLKRFVQGAIIDVIHGAPEAPRQIVGGIADAGKELLQFGNEMDLAVADHLGYWPALNLTDPLKRGLIVNKAEDVYRKSVGESIPTTTAPKSGTGAVIRTGAQFLAPFGATSKLSAGVKVTSTFGKITKATVQGAVVDFTAFDPYQDRFSDILKDMPTGAARPFFEWMAEEDSAFEGRAKNALEGGLTGITVDSFLSLASGVKSFIRAKAAARRSADGVNPIIQEGAVDAAQKQALEADLPEKMQQTLGDEPVAELSPARDQVTPDAAPAEVTPKPELSPAQKLKEKLYAEQIQAEQNINQTFDELMGPSKPDDALRARTEAERAVDEIEALPAMEARAKAEEITGKKASSKKEAIEAVRKSINAETKPYINTRMINTEDDLHDTIRNLADKYKSEVAQGVRKTEAVIADAQAIKDFEELSKTRPERLTDAEQYALREMWASSAQQVKNLAEQAALSNDPTVQFAFRRAVTMHRSIQAYAFEARASAARQLRQWAIPVGTNKEMLSVMSDTLDTFGGAQAGQKLAQQLSNAFASGNRMAAENLVKRGWLEKSVDMITELGVSAKLYQPSTHLVNMGGNALLMQWEVLNRYVAEGIGSVMGNGVQRGEAMMMQRGLALGFRDGLREARATLRSGITYSGGGKMEMPRQSAFDPARLEIEEGTLAAKAAKVVATGVQAPFRALGAADSFFKVLNERGEIYAQAMRKAAMEAGDDPQQAKKLFAEYVQNPDRVMQEASRKAAEERTFTQPATGLTKTLMNLRSAMPVGTGYLLFPFIQTPANILSYAVRSSPFAFSLKSFRDAISAGGAQADIAWARMATGTTMLGLAYDMAENGEITGGGPPPGHKARSAWLRQNKPYSFKMGDTNVQYSRADPFGLWLGTAADLYEMNALVDWDKDMAKETDELFIAISFSLGNTMMNKTWMTGASDFVEALANPQQYSEGYIQRMLTGFVPSGVKTAARVKDPKMREVEDIMDAFKASFGLSEGLPLKRDWLGREIDRSSGLGSVYDFMSPIAVSPDRAEPIDREILRLGWGPSKPNKTISYNGTSISLRNRLDLYSRYVELSGQVKRSGKTLNEQLNEIVQGKGSYGRAYMKASDGPEGEKTKIIGNIVLAYREIARAELIKENHDWFDAQANIRLNRRDMQNEEQRRANSGSFVAQ